MKKQLPKSIRDTKPDQVNECLEWFGAPAEQIEAEEKKQIEIKSLINKIKSK